MSLELTPGKTRWHVVSYCGDSIRTLCKKEPLAVDQVFRFDIAPPDDMPVCATCGGIARWWWQR